MISSNRRWLGGLAVAVALLPASAEAQTMARSFGELKGILKAEEIVAVIDKAGQETTGKVAEITASSLVLIIPEKSRGLEIYTGGVTRTFAEDNVAAIMRSDRSGNRTRIYLAPLVATFSGLATVLGPGTTVIVTDTMGRRVKGPLTALDPDSLSLVTEGRLQRLARPDIWEVRQRIPDSKANGALYGAMVGTGVALWDQFRDISEPLSAPIWALTVGVGSAVGAGIDALANTGSQVLYRSPQQARRLTIAPFVERNQQGVLVSVRF